MRRLALLLALAAAWPLAAVQANYALPPLPSPEKYGTLMLDQFSSSAGQQAVVFPHWLHRMLFTCEVCHTELEIEMEAGGTGINEAAIAQGRYCGACHDGVKYFGREKNCRFCHGSYPGRNRKQWLAVFSKRPFPTTDLGSYIDWSESLRRGMIKPVRSLQPGYQAMTLDRDLTIAAELGSIAPAVFPHDSHLEWMDCNMCHPYPFNLKLKGTQSFSMRAILKGEFCGACHLNVAFPMDDCRRCHPKMGDY